MPLGAAPLALAEFGGLIAPLGPFEPMPRLAVAVSGGADSLSLCLLADQWAREREGTVLALIVDHGLRAAAAGEALATAGRLRARGIASETWRLPDLRPGPGIAARARDARLAALEHACVRRGILHLLLGHHAADQAETRLIRAGAASGPAGLACMSPLRETSAMRVLRPLLGVSPERLRATLRAADLAWVEDPSNQDTAALRVRLRPDARRDMRALCEAAQLDGLARADGDARLAAALARVTIRPEGFAIVDDPAIGAQAWSALIQTIAGTPYPPARDAIARLAARPAPRTLGGARLSPAGRHGRGLLVTREQAAMAPDAPALVGAKWDGRFRLVGAAPDAVVGALGADAARLRDRSDLPALVLRTLPALRVRGALATVPHLAYRPQLAHRSSTRPPDDPPMEPNFVFDPPRPAACAPFATAP